MKARVNLNLYKLNVPEKIEAGRLYILTMTGNADFLSPTPSLATITTSVDALESAYIRARNGGTEQTSIMYDCEEVLDKQLIQLAAYVEYIANGNETIILSAGMQVKKKGGRSPYILDATNGRHTGEVILHSPSTTGAAYVWQIKKDDVNTDQDWEELVIANTAKITVQDLIAGNTYWFRVSTRIKNVIGDWSDPISIIVQ
jgi:hypothetical protein